MSNPDQQHHSWSLERDRLELIAEAHASVIPQERATIRAELRQVEGRFRERERQQEELAGLPAFWGSIHGEGGDEPRFLALFSAVRPTPGAKLTMPREAFFAYPAETAAALSWIDREAAAGQELYQCAHLTRQWRRRRDDAAPLHSLYVDLDHDQLAGDVPSPSVVVESSPGRWQCYWRLTEPVTPAIGAQLNRRLTAAVCGDPGGWDLTQLLRIPGTHNGKYAEQPLVQVVSMLSGVQHDPNELDQLLPQVGRPSSQHTVAHRQPPRPLPSPQPSSEPPPLPLTRPALRIWRGEQVRRNPSGTIDRSASLLAIGRLLYAARLPRDAIVAHLAERDVALGYQKYADRADAETQYNAIVDFLDAASQEVL